MIAFSNALRRITLVAALLSALAGCGGDPSPDPAAPEAPAYAAVARGQVAVEGGLLQLGAPREGTVATLAVHEGEAVHRGQTLATLDAEPARLRVQIAEARLKQAEAEARLFAGKLALAQVKAGRLAAAAKAGAGDGQSADDARGEAQELAGRQAVAEAAVEVARQARDSARYELGLRTLRAPIDARITHVGAQPGASVSPQSGPLFVLLPQTPPVVRAELNESLVDAVRVGMPATVSSDSSDQSWPAHVLRIGSVVGPSTLEDDPQQRLDSRTVNCVLAFDSPAAGAAHRPARAGALRRAGGRAAKACRKALMRACPRA